MKELLLLNSDCPECEKMLLKKISDCPKCVESLYQNKIISYCSSADIRNDPVKASNCTQSIMKINSDCPECEKTLLKKISDCPECVDNYFKSKIVSYCSKMDNNNDATKNSACIQSIMKLNSDCPECEKALLKKISDCPGCIDDWYNKKLNKAKNQCENVNEQYAICNDNKYIRDTKNADGLKRDMKKIEERIDSEKLNSGSNAVTK
jgi:hypothetical protein